MIRFLKNLLPTQTRLAWGIGCSTCGRVLLKDEANYGDDNTTYCVDCWPGYISCATIGCNHYMCEHAEDVGCGNGGCYCKKYTTAEELAVQHDNITRAAHDVYWDISEMYGVIEIEPEVKTTVVVHIKLDFSIKDVARAVFLKQFALQQKYPDVDFDFRITGK